MAYEWPRNLCNGRGIPYEKLAGVYLEKTDANGQVVARETFSTQEAVDAAWADGFHSPGMPQTRDCMPEPEVVTEEITSDARLDYIEKLDASLEEDKEEEGPTTYYCEDCDFDTLSEHGLKVHRATKHKE